MTLKIEKGVPMRPMQYSERESPLQAVPWDSMEIGDSVLIPDELMVHYANRWAAVATYARQRGMAIKCRKDGNGIRIWRTG